MEPMLQILFWAAVPIVVIWLALGYIWTVAYIMEVISYDGETDENEWIN